MSMELIYPYQMVAFLLAEPEIGESVYNGSNGWYPQIALKRRFRVVDTGEDDMMKQIAEFCQNHDPLEIQSHSLVKPDHMPVKVIEVEYTNQLKNFHLGFISLFGDKLISRYPERDGENYYPHITAEYWNKLVIDVEDYSNKTWILNRVCLLKDIKDEDSKAYKYFDLGTKTSQ